MQVCSRVVSLPEELRASFVRANNRRHQKEFGQFLTPPHIAALMASMFESQLETVRLLDAGAGLGMLSAAFVQRELRRKTPPRRIDVTAYELDKALIDGLHETYDACRVACLETGVDFSAQVLNADFIEDGADFLRGDLFSQAPPLFDAAIANPPYGKLSTTSSGYRRLRSIGLETTNLYTAFLNLLIGLLGKDGELVDITPRSFCNGPYFKAFRKRLMAEMSLRRIHTFESRSAAFKHDKVLQENIVLHAVKTPKRPQTITISSSGGGGGEDDIRALSLPATEIVLPSDSEAFIHIPTSEQHLAVRNEVSRLESSLERLGLTVSTGKVVGFRVREHIVQDPQADTCPLIHPCHFDGLFVTWPGERGRKPNAIRDTDNTRRLLIPSGVYVITKRFTSKEERRRVVACIYDPNRIHSERVGFENHLNYFHAGGNALDIPLAKGLWAYLNSSILDLYFRQFNGHTQVNATDLRNVRFPTADQLRAIVSEVGDHSLQQNTIDQVIARELNA